jgi:hypothetical protein
MLKIAVYAANSPASRASGQDKKKIYGGDDSKKPVMNIEDLKEARGAHKHARRGAAWARGEFNSDVFSNPSDMIKHISKKGRPNRPEPSKSKAMTQAVKGPLPTMSHMAKTVASVKPKMTSREKASDTAKTVAEKAVRATAKTRAISDVAKTVVAKIPSAKKTVGSSALTNSGRTVGAKPSLKPKKALATPAISDWRNNVITGPRKVMRMEAIKGA